MTISPSQANVRQAVCLVGGRGTRLGLLTDSTPKPLLEVGGRPFLDYIVHEARRFGLRQLLLLTGYRSEAIESRYHGRRFGDLAVQVVVEPSPAGTAGALANAASYLDETFFLLNGDSYFDLNWLALVPSLGRSDWLVHAALANGVEGGRYGRVTLTDGLVRGFRPDGASSQPINAGVYLVRRRILAEITGIPCSLEREILPQLALSSRLLGTARTGAFIDIGVPGDFAKSQELLPLFMRRPAAFLDRDGVLNRDDGYVHLPRQIVWIDGAIETVRWLNDNGYYVFVITNQGGVAHGYYDQQHVHELHDWMQQQLQLHGAHIDAFEYCPYHPQGAVEEFRSDSEFRKPRPGMITKLQREWSTDPGRSFVLGDRDSDMQAATAAGLPGFRFQGGNLLRCVQDNISSGPRAPA